MANQVTWRLVASSRRGLLMVWSLYPACLFHTTYYLMLHSFLGLRIFYYDYYLTFNNSTQFAARVYYSYKSMAYYPPAPSYFGKKSPLALTSPELLPECVTRKFYLILANITLLAGGNNWLNSYLIKCSVPIYKMLVLIYMLWRGRHPSLLFVVFLDISLLSILSWPFPLTFTCKTFLSFFICRIIVLAAAWF